MEIESETRRGEMTKTTVIKDDGRYLYLYTFPTEPTGDDLDAGDIDELPEDPHV